MKFLKYMLCLVWLFGGEAFNILNISKFMMKTTLDDFKIVKNHLIKWHIIHKLHSIHKLILKTSNLQ